RSQVILGVAFDPPGPTPPGKEGAGGVAGVERIGVLVRDLGDDMVDCDGYLPLNARGGLALWHAGDVAHAEDVAVAHVAQSALVDLHPAFSSPGTGLPGERTVADGLGRAHGGNDVDEVIALFLGSRRSAERGDALARINGFENALVVHLDAAFLEQHAYLLRHYGRSEEHTSELQSRENLVCRLL